MSDLSDEELLAELGVSVEAKPVGGRTAREERIIAGFEDILRFHEAHGRAPRHGEGLDIFERIYAVRLDRLRGLAEARALLAEMDRPGLLTPVETVAVEALDDEALLAGLGTDVTEGDDIRVLRHVSSREERRAAEEIADHARCLDFERFRPLFAAAEADLKAGRREARRFGRDAAIATGEFFILGGQMVYVAETGEVVKAPNGENDARLRVIYANGTESNLLRRSLQRALYKDEAGRRLSDVVAGPLFGGVAEAEDVESGTIYVLRSKSEHPFVAEHREVVHKIGVTGGEVRARIANAAHDATYLLAEVEEVASYRLYGIKRAALEGVLHRVFAPARLDLEIADRFGTPVRPREWFLVPLAAIDEAVERIRDGSIVDYVYDPRSARLLKMGA